jgi:ribosomal protein L7/L12
MDDETRAAIDQINARLDHIEQHLVDISQHGALIRYAPMGRNDYRASNASSIPADVIELVESGKRFDAIRRYRELTGVTTQEAADVIDGVAPAQ